MKKLQKSLVLILLGIILASPLAAFDWGGHFMNITGGAGIIPKVGFEQTNRLSFWFKQNFNFAPNTYLAGEAYYQLKYTHLDKTLAHIVDLNLFKFNVGLPMNTASAAFSFGRYGLKDLTGLIFSQTSDGIEFTFNNNTVLAGAYVGFTGLLNALAVKINAPENAKKTPVYSLATPFIVIGLSARGQNLFAQQSLAGEFYGFFDVSPSKNGGHRMYISASLNGPIAGPVFYLLSSTLGLLYTSTEIPVQISNLSRFELSVYLPFWLSALTWNTVFATGKQKNVDNFQPFTAFSPTADGLTVYAGNIKTGISFAAKPVPPLIISISEDLLLNVMNDDLPKGFAALQTLLSIRWQALSDLEVSFSGGHTMSQNKSHYLFANLKVLFSF